MNKNPEDDCLPLSEHLMDLDDDEDANRASAAIAVKRGMAAYGMTREEAERMWGVGKPSGQ